MKRYYFILFIPLTNVAFNTQRAEANKERHEIVNNFSDQINELTNKIPNRFLLQEFILGRETVLLFEKTGIIEKEEITKTGINSYTHLKNEDSFEFQKSHCSITANLMIYPALEA